MVYSEQVDGVFCIACGIFVAKVSKGKFVCKPFRDWNKKGKKAKEHEQCLYHHQAIEQADNFKRTLENSDTTITAQSDTRRAANVARNRAVLKSIASAVLYCARQCIALRGDAESVESLGNPGNFLSLLRLLAVHDEELRRHLEIPVMRWATYLSPQTQNELIKVMGNHILLQRIIDDLTAAPFYAILADQVTSHNVEHLAICARFVDRSTKEVREEFLTFLKLDRITGERIADGIFGFLKENNISLATMRGQGYDGASNMSSDRVGVQARIRHKAPLATYVHCSGHCLNLVISKSCALPEVRNVIDCVKKCSRFFLNSPKRSGVLEKIIKHNVVSEERRKPLIDLCKTRWAERHSAYRHSYQGYVFVVEALEMIAFRYHLEKYGATYADWDYADRSEAQQILASVTSFQLLLCL